MDWSNKIEILPHPLTKPVMGFARITTAHVDREGTNYEPVAAECNTPKRRSDTLTLIVNIECESSEESSKN